MNQKKVLYRMRCETCGYARTYWKRWEAEESAKMHMRDNLCGNAIVLVDELRHSAREVKQWPA